MRNLFVLFSAFILFFLQITALVAQPVVYDDSIPSGKNYDRASFRLMVPKNIAFIKGVIVLVPGSNGDGRNWVLDSAWQNLAFRNNLALLGCYYTDLPHDNMAIEEYANVKQGSGDALLNVLLRLAKSTHHEELSGAPLFLWGISAGGEFNYEFACWRPERVAAFVVNKGGVYYTALCSSETRKVPGLFFTGEDDMEFRNKIIEGIFTINRRFGAIWTFAEEPCTRHEIGSSKTLSIKFFNEIMQMRIPDRETDVQKPVRLLFIREEDGYLGDFKNKEYYPFKDRKEIGYPTAWLPGREFAEAWLSLIKVECTDKADIR
jgi:poly(3-hydroxybutyrate) depolymerase